MHSLGAIHALSTLALHEALAEHCLGWRRCTTQEHARLGSTHQAPDGGRYCVPDYTGEWEALMPLVLRTGICQRWSPQEGHWTLFHPSVPDALIVVPRHERSRYRRRLAELVLYVTRLKEPPDAPPP